MSAEARHEQEVRRQAEIAETPTPQVGDWVRDWADNRPMLWTKALAVRLEKYPSTRLYISEIRRGDGYTWVRR